MKSVFQLRNMCSDIESQNFLRPFETREFFITMVHQDTSFVYRDQQ